MTISSTIRTVSFTGNGSAATFAFAFKVFEASDLLVTSKQTATGIVTTLALTTDYSVALNANQEVSPGGSITLAAGPLATGFTLTITSDIPMTQPAEFINAGGFYPEVLTESLDRLTILGQQLQLAIDAVPIPTIVGGSATALATGSNPTVTVTGSNPFALNLGIPTGATGATGATGDTGMTGATGAPGTNGIASLAQLAAVRVAAPSTPNLFNLAAITAGSYLVGSTGALVSNSSYSVSGYIVANTGGTMATSVQIANGTFGYSFYDQSFAFISGSNTSVVAGGTITVPNTAAYLRVSMLNTGVLAAMIVNGSTLPAAYARFAPVVASELQSSVNFANSLVAGKLQGGANLFNSAALTVGALKVDGTIDATATTQSTSNYMYVAGQSFITASVSLPSATGVYGTCFYDANFNFLSSTGSVTTPTPLAIPALAAYVRVYLNNVTINLTNVMIVAGSTLPSSYVPFAYSAALGSSNLAQIMEVINSSLNVSRNLFDQVTSTSGSIMNASTGAITALANYFVSAFIPVIPGASYTFGVANGISNATYGGAYFDANSNFIAAGPASPIAAGTTITVPANATMFRFSGALATLGTQVLVLGTSTPVGYIAHGTPVPPSSQKKVGFWGDSILALYGGFWMPTILSRAGVSNAFQDARAGRDFAHAFENYSGGVSTGTNLGPSSPEPGTNTGTAGNTLAQDLAGLDGMVCELGTNDQYASPTYPIGAPGDATTAGTTYGYIRAFIEGVLTANPTMRLIMIAPYNSQARGILSASPTLTPSVVTAIQSVAANYGVPVLDVYHSGGINQFNWASVLQSDGLHINALGGSLFFGPQIAEFLKDKF